MTAPFSTHASQHLLFLSYLFDNSHSDRCEVVSHCGFDLHFLDVIAVGSMEILTILILPIHEHSIFFHLFISSLISFDYVLEFSKYRFFISLVKFIPRYFILFDLIVNEIVFWISLSESSLLV